METFSVGQVVWVRSYSTRRSSVGVITEQGIREPDGVPMAVVDLAIPYYTSWDDPDTLTTSEPDWAGQVVLVEAYRLEPIEW